MLEWCKRPYNYFGKPHCMALLLAMVYYRLLPSSDTAYDRTPLIHGIFRQHSAVFSIMLTSKGIYEKQFGLASFAGYCRFIFCESAG